MPQHTGYIERDPDKRPHIYEWTSDYANDTNINAYSGMGYFLHRSTSDIIVEFPKYPYDGDVVSFIDVTKEDELPAATGEVTISNTYPVGYANPPSIIYMGQEHAADTTFNLDYLRYYQQFFIYVKSINKWLGSFVRIDATIRQVIVTQTYGIIYYGECYTRGNYTAKEVDVDNSFVLGVGAHIRVVFSEAGTSDTCTINVNNTGNIPIQLTKTTSAGPGLWKDGQAIDMVYDGMSWLVVDTSAGGTGGGLTQAEVNTLIADYLRDHNITGASEEQIKKYVKEYLDQHGGGSVNESDVIRIINNNFGNKLWTEQQIKNLILANQPHVWTEEEIVRLIKAHVETNIQLTDAVKAEIKRQVDAEITSSVGTIIDQKTAATIAQLNAQTDAKMQQVTQQVNDAVANMQSTINTTKAELKTSIDNAITEIQNSIDTRISTAFDASIDQKIQANFAGQVTDQINASKAALEAQIKAAKDDLTNQITTANDTLTTSINQAVTDLKNDVDTRLNNIQTEVQNIVNTTFSTTIDQKIDAAFNATIDQKIKKAFEGAEGTLNTAIANYQTIITQQFTEIQADLNTRMTNIQNQVDAKLTDLENKVDQKIQTTFDTMVDQKIQANFDATIDQKIQAAFIGQIQTEINKATNQLRTVINQEITTAKADLQTYVNTETDKLNTKIQQLEASLDAKILDAYNTVIKDKVDAKIAQLESQIDNKISTTFDTQIDAKIAAAFDTTIDQKVETAINNKVEGMVDTKIATAVNKIEKDLNNKIDARINVQCQPAGLITALVKQKCEEYVAPAIGASY